MNFQTIPSKIHAINGKKILFDFDLATLYQVETRVLKPSVRRNINRFLEDYMIQLTKVEWKKVITICNNLPENVQYSPVTPFAFTKQGVTMLSSVLGSNKAIEVNFSIVRDFVLLR